MPQHFQDMIKGNLNSSSCSFYKLVAWETWVKLACVAWRSKFARSRPNLRPRPQGFSLKKWVGHPCGFSAPRPPLLLSNQNRHATQARVKSVCILLSCEPFFISN